MTMTKMAAAALLPLCLALQSCGGDSSQTYSDGDGNEMDISRSATGDETNFEIRTEDGNNVKVQSGTAVPVDLPDGFSVYPGANVISSTNATHSGGRASIVHMTSSDSFDDIVGYYRNQAETQGFEIRNESRSGDARIINGQGEDGNQFNLMVADGDEGRMIQLSVSDPLESSDAD